VSQCFQTPLDSNFLFCFVCERHVKRLVFIENYDIKFLLSLPKWLFLVHESDFLCFKCSSIRTLCFIVKIL